MVDGGGGSEGKGGSRIALSGGGRRRDSQVWRSACRLGCGTMSVVVFCVRVGRRWQLIPGYLLLQVLYLG